VQLLLHYWALLGALQAGAIRASRRPVRAATPRGNQIAGVVSSPEFVGAFPVASRASTAVRHCHAYWPRSGRLCANADAAAGAGSVEPELNGCPSAEAAAGAGSAEPNCTAGSTDEAAAAAGPGSSRAESSSSSSSSSSSGSGSGSIETAVPGSALRRGTGPIKYKLYSSSLRKAQLQAAASAAQLQLQLQPQPQKVRKSSSSCQQMQGVSDGTNLTARKRLSPQR
jgi:hypothetical protein